jgi:hypothetical protein
MPADSDLVTYLDSATTLTSGTDLFVGPMPEMPDNCVAVTHYNSQRSDDYAMGASLSAPGYEIEDVQLMVRNTSRSMARADADAYHALIANMHSATLSGRAYFRVDEEGTPFCIGQDQNGRWRFVANYEIKKARG